MPILHGANLSPYVRKVRVALAFKGIEYDDNQVVPFGPTPEFQALSPLKKIPVYQDGDLVLPDSSVILAYLECAHPTPALLPADAGERGRALWFEEYGDTKVTTNLATVFFQRFVGPRFLNLETDEAAIRDAIDEQLPPVFDYLSEQLGDSDYLVGGMFSIADIAITTGFVNFRIGGEEIDAGRWPALAAYVERVHGHPAFKPIVEGDIPKG
jgi:glutathione S-transferase